MVLFLGPAALQAQEGLFEAFEGKADIIVAADGSGDYTTLTAALDAVPNNSSTRTVVFIRKGTYYEKIYIGAAKRNLTLVGEHVDSVILTYDDYADKVGGTFNTSSFRVEANGFRAMNLTFENSSGDVGQALALYTDGDRQVFLHCRLLGWQDTFYSGSPYRNYFKDCFIEGSVDFIFGETVIIYDSCQIHSIRDGGYLTAASTNEGYAFGYVFRNCNITGGPGITGNVLGRPWKAYAQTVFMDSYLHGLIRSSGWREWNGNEQTCYYAEYNNEGPGWYPDNRVAWSHILTEQEAAAYTMENIFSGATGTAYSDNWMPDVAADSQYMIVKEHVMPFMDSSNYNAGILSVDYGGEGALEFSPEQYKYGIELPSGTTEVPVLSVMPQDPRAKVEIEYPDELPGPTSLRVVAYDRSTVAEYDIYNSVDSAYHNAYLDSLYLKNIRVEGFQPDVFEYNMVLPAGSSRYFAIDMYTQAPDSKTSYIRPGALPGELRITVTSYSGEVENEYVVHITLATGISQAEARLDFTVHFHHNLLVSSIYMEKPGALLLEVYDLNGRTVAERREILPGGEHRVSFPADLGPGVYLYRASTGTGTAAGKFSVRQ